MGHIHSELKKVRHPQDENGLLYYTPISFEINNEKVEVPMKIKTGTDIFCHNSSVISRKPDVGIVLVYVIVVAVVRMFTSMNVGAN